MTENDSALRAAERALAEGQMLLGAGRAAEAMVLVRRAGSLKPDDAGVLYLSGVFAHAAGRRPMADRLLSQASALVAQAPEIAFARGNLRLDQGRPDAAELFFRRALELRADFHAARAALAQSLIAQGRDDLAEGELQAAMAAGGDAAELRTELATSRLRRGRTDGVGVLLRAAIALVPASARPHFLRADLFRRHEDAAAAMASYLRAVSIDRTHAGALQGLGLLLGGAVGAAALRRSVVLRPGDAGSWFALAEAERERQDWAAAVVLLQRSLASAPDRLDAAIHLGNALDELDRRAEATAVLHHVLDRVPADPLALSNLATILLQDGDVEAATRLYRQAVVLTPGNAVAHYNLGNAGRQRLDVADALRHYRHAVVVDPSYATAHWNDAITRLMGGDWADGFRGYEWRWRDREEPMPSHAPWWRGGVLQDRRILLLAEQGYGDMIHFARYARAVVDAGGRAVMECYQPLRRLFATLSPGLELIDVGAAPGQIDLQAALMQLPLIFGSTPERAYAPVPYLSAAADGSRLPAREGFKIGLVWAGNPRIEKFHKRSATLNDFLPLLAMPGVAAYSLQVGPRAADIAALGCADRLTDLAPLIGDFADTAALVAQLDLVVAVDTAVAHVAGALGKPVWMMPTYVPDWRWLLRRDDTPWYPTMRLYRQGADRRWPPVIARVARDLAVLGRR
jgi:tetratricopeptide (TPR) repeat protein